MTLVGFNGRMISARALVVWAIVVLSLMGAPPVQAADPSRSGAQADPQESAPTIDGSRREEDVAQVRAHYDPAGTVQVVARFYEPIPEDSVLEFTIYFGSGGRGPEGFCRHSNPGDPYLTTELEPWSYDGPYIAMGINNYDGTVEPRRTFSADRRQVFLQASHPAIANRSLNCTDGGDLTVTARSCSTCGTSETASFDDIVDFDLNGTDPPEPFPVRPACADGLDNDGDKRIDDIDSNCEGPNDASEHPPICRDRKDNDGDGSVDQRDLGCRYGTGEVLVKTPRYGAAGARADLARALRLRFGRVFLKLARYKPACRRSSSTSFRCRPTLTRGNVSYQGSVRLALSRDGEKVFQLTKGSLRRLDRKCAQRLRRADRGKRAAACSRSFRIRHRREL